MHLQDITSASFECRLQRMRPARDVPVHLTVVHESGVRQGTTGTNEASMLVRIADSSQRSARGWTVRCVAINPFLQTPLTLVLQPTLHVHLFGSHSSSIYIHAFIFLDFLL